MEKLAQPPHQVTTEDRLRRVGVELEFIGLSAATAAELVANVLGGKVETKSKHRCVVNTPKYGEFVIELDTIYAHQNNMAYNELAKKLDIAEDLAELVGDMSREFVPMEIVGPPIDWPDLTCYDAIVTALREQGAKGTNAAPYYAFGCQLNPEVTAPTVEAILPTFQAFIVMEPWLRKKSNHDLTRKLTSFADPFPKRYQAKVLSADYAPTMEEFIDDYLKANPTRNRAVDMLPLFKHIMPEKIQDLGDERIKARPTFHYRLPDCPLGDTTWRVADEWNRWVQVEELANNPEELKTRCQVHLDNLNRSAYRKTMDWLNEKLS